MASSEQNCRGRTQSNEEGKANIFSRKSNSCSGFFKIPREANIGSKNWTVREFRDKTEGVREKKSPKWLLIFMSNSPFLYKEVKGNLLGESCSSCHLESYFPFNYNVRLSRRKWLLAQVIGRFEKIGLREILIPLYMERYPVYSQAFSQLAIWLYCRCQLFVEYFLCICSLRTKWLWLEAELIKSNLAHGFKFHIKILILAIVTIDRVDSFQIKQNKFKMWLSFFLRKRMLKMMYNLLWWRSGIISCQISLMQRWRNWRKGSWLKHSEFI